MGWKNETYIYLFVGYTNLSVFNMGYKTLITTIFQLDDLANETSLLFFFGKISMENLLIVDGDRILETIFWYPLVI